jgi:outer membrane biosynthesis protein TonB
MPIEPGMEKISQPVRILAIVIVLAGAAGMLAMRMLAPSAAPETSAAAVVPHTVATPKPKPKAKAKAKPDKAVAKAKPDKAVATPTKAKPKAKAKAAPAKKAPAVPALNAPLPDIPPTGFPLAVDAALRKHAVLVVSLVVPGARVDELSAAEAKAGAKISGAGYLSLNVLNENVARALLLAKLDVKEPRVLVMKRSGEVTLALVGFADRETVAQAAANASL